MFMHRFDESGIMESKTAYRIKACHENGYLNIWNRLPIDSDKPIDLLGSDTEDLFDIHAHVFALSLTIE